MSFENLFSKHARTFPDKLTLGELWNMTEANREAFDIFGWYMLSIAFRQLLDIHVVLNYGGCRVASKMEWAILYVLARDQDGFLSKEAIRRCYDGSLFEYCAKMQMGAEGKMK